MDQLQPAAVPGADRLLQGVGIVCWALIVPIKMLRVLGPAAGGTLLVGVAPSFLGSAGLCLLLAGRRGRRSRYSLLRAAALASATALALEFAQRLPRPGILARVFYRFDWLDVAASLAGIGAACLLAWLARRPARAPGIR